MTVLSNFLVQWQLHILTFLALSLISICVFLCFKIRWLVTQNKLLKLDLDNIRSSGENILQDKNNLQQDLTQSELNNEQLRHQVVEFKVRLEERERYNELMEMTVEKQQKECKDLSERHTSALAELAEVKMSMSKEQTHQKEKLDLVVQSREKLKQELQLLAKNLLDSNTANLAANNQSQVKQLLDPVREQLRNFQNKVEDVYEKESNQRFSLTAEISKLQVLNQRISKDAIALTNALKGENKIVGNWGEMVLERLLESSGLTRDRDFLVQASFKDSDKSSQRLQPDIVIKLPQGKSIVVDSKVSLSAYERMYNAQHETEREIAAKDHLQSIRQHIKQLSRKKYHGIHELKTLDFVLLFIPLESAFIEAIKLESRLTNEAYHQNIIIVSPSTLLATLRIIQGLWQQQLQNQNAVEIARLAGSLYDKFASFGEDLLMVGQRLEQSQNAYQQVIGRLSEGRGNLLSRVEKLKVLGARTSKALPEELNSLQHTVNPSQNNQQSGMAAE